MSFTISGRLLIVDPTHQEEELSSGCVTVVTNGDDVCSVVKLGNVSSVCVWLCFALPWRLCCPQLQANPHVAGLWLCSRKPTRRAVSTMGSNDLVVGKDHMLGPGRRRMPTNWVSSRTLQPSIESVVANSFVPSDFLVDGQVSWLGNVHPLLTLNFFSTWILPLHAFFPLILCTKPFGDRAMDDGGRL